MKHITFAVGALTILTAACVHNQTASTAAGQIALDRRGFVGTIPGGAVLEGRLNHSVSPARAKIGEPFSIKLVENSTTEHHASVVPPGSVVYGHITQVDMNNRSGSVASVQLAFDSLAYSGHHHVLDANISKVGAERVSITPVKVPEPQGTAAPASVTLLSFADANGQIPTGSTVTLIVTNPIRLDAKE